MNPQATGEDFQEKAIVIKRKQMTNPGIWTLKNFKTQGKIFFEMQGYGYTSAVYLMIEQAKALTEVYS